MSVSETSPLARMEITMVMENSRKMRPISPLMNTSGMKTAASESVMARIVKLISLADFSDASKALQSFLHQPDGVLQEHDGVIDQEADRQRERHERKVVEAVAEQVHGDERKQQRERQGHGGNQSVGGAAQENEDDHDHQHESDVERHLHVVDAVDDGLRAVISSATSRTELGSCD